MYSLGSISRPSSELIIHVDRSWDLSYSIYHAGKNSHRHMVIIHCQRAAEYTQHRERGGVKPRQENQWTMPSWKNSGNQNASFLGRGDRYCA